MPRLKYFLRSSVYVICIGALLCCGKSAEKPADEKQLNPFGSASEMVAAIRQGRITSVALLNLYIDRIKRYNDDLNAVVALDVDAARERAAAADKALASGESWGPLHGLPMTVKDVFEVVGMPATSGDPRLKNHIPNRNAVAVQRLVDAGAIILGKTNVPYHAMDIQSYNDIYGTTNNPWDLSRTPGGSSGGSAAALAAGLTPLELGSDIGGSVRIPAHYTGLFGHKTTFGIIPRYGHIPPMPGEVAKEKMPEVPLFVLGPLARSADDLALALEVLTAPGLEETHDLKAELLPPRKAPFKAYRVAVWFEDPYPPAEIDTEVHTVLNNAVDRLRRAGLKVDEKARPEVGLYEMDVVFGQIFERMMTRSLPLPEWLVAEQDKIGETWASFFENYDVLLAPVAPTVAFPHDHEGTIMTRTITINGKDKSMLASMTWTRLAVVAKLPATVAPVGFDESGLPVGIQIIGARLEDRTTIDFAKGLSALIGGFQAPPAYED
jgi:amidase